MRPVLCAGLHERFEFDSASQALARRKRAVARAGHALPAEFDVASVALNDLVQSRAIIEKQMRPRRREDREGRREEKSGFEAFEKLKRDTGLRPVRTIRSLRNRCFLVFCHLSHGPEARVTINPLEIRGFSKVSFLVHPAEA